MFEYFLMYIIRKFLENVYLKYQSAHYTENGD